MATTISTVQATLFGEPIVRTRYHFAPGEFREKREHVQLEYCANPSCRLNASRNGWRMSSFVVGKRIRVLEKYAPRQEQPDLVYYCPDCVETVGIEDCSECVACNRLVYDDDGHNSYFAWKSGDYICLACYEKETLRDGMEPDEKPYRWFSDVELYGAGWIRQAEYSVESNKATYQADLKRHRDADLLVIKQDNGYGDVAIWTKHF